MIHVIEAKHISDFTLWVAFDDGTSGNINLEGVLEGPIFLPLKDINIFSKVFVDPELETVVWPNGADLAPEFLKDLHNKQNQSAE